MVTIYGIEGFELGYQYLAYASGGTFSIQSTTKRTGTYALKINPTSSYGYYQPYLRYLTTNGTGDNLCAAQPFLRFYFRFASSVSSDTPIFSNSNESCMLYLTSANKLKANSTTGTTTLKANKWYRIEISIDTGSTYFIVRINGIEEFNQTATLAHASAILGRTSGSYTCEFYYDDFAMGDTWIGAGKINLIAANADGDDTAWTATGAASKWDCVDEIPPDGDTTYLTTSSGNKDTLSNLQSCSTAGIIGTIKAVQGCAIERDTGTGSPKYRFRHKSSSTAIELDQITSSATSYRVLGACRITDLDSVAWTSTTVDSYQIGMATDGGASAEMRLTSCTAQVENGGENFESEYSAVIDGKTASTSVSSSYSACIWGMTSGSSSYNAVIKAATLTSSSNDAVIYGKTNTSSGFSSNIWGATSTSSSYGGLISGKTSSSDSFGAVIHGKTSGNSSYAGISWGRNSDSSGNSAVVFGKIIETSSYGCELWGYNSGSSSYNSIIAGIYSDSSSKSAVISGKTSSDSSFSACEWGMSSSSSSNPSVIFGKIVETSTTNAVTWGAVLGENSSKDARTWGVTSGNSSYSAIIHGSTSGNSSYPSCIWGATSANSSKDARTWGTLSDNSSYSANIWGTVSTSSSYSSCIWGSASDNSFHSSIIHGRVSTSDSFSAIEHGWTFGNSSKSAVICGYASESSSYSGTIWGWLSDSSSFDSTITGVFRASDSFGAIISTCSTDESYIDAVIFGCLHESSFVGSCIIGQASYAPIGRMKIRNRLPECTVHGLNFKVSVCDDRDIKLVVKRFT